MHLGTKYTVSFITCGMHAYDELTTQPMHMFLNGQPQHPQDCAASSVCLSLHLTIVGTDFQVKCHCHVCVTSKRARVTIGLVIL